MKMTDTLTRELRIHVTTRLPIELDAAYVKALLEKIKELLPTGEADITADIMGVE